MDLCNQDRQPGVALGAHLNASIAQSIADRNAGG
jgi:hypothetical protein